MAEGKSTGFRIKKISDLMQVGADHDMKEMGLTYSQFHVMLYLHHRRDEQIPLKQLERFFQVSQATMAGIVVRLEQKGYVHACVDEHDRRVKLVSITELGENACERAHANMVEREGQIFSCISAEDKEKLDEMLDRILMTLKKMTKEGCADE
ncbi:MAG: MarR family transcriptional regulator [Bulleidia sp.]|nr:MarR family transcriptional regulator [Bulleidia sp.]